MDGFFLVVLIGYILSSLSLIPYPINLVYLAFKSRKWRNPIPKSIFTEENLPTVAIHLPVYNEQKVILTTLDSLLALDYPADKLTLMLLDDSTDETSAIIDQYLADHQYSCTIEILRRGNREGYKAGALAEATLKTSAEFIAIFDADCKVPANFFRDTIHFFSDSSISAIQTRWEHSNLHYSLFTLAMSVGLDGHFLIEKEGRIRSNGFIAFNGTGGIWRRSSIIKAGNWSGRTLAEDLDIAFRSQLQSQKIQYVPQVTVLQEIAPTLTLWGIQQTRWSRGFAQNIRLHFKDVVTKKHSKSRFQGAIQLTAYLVPFFLFLNIIFGALLLFSPDYTSISSFLIVLNVSLAVVSISGLIVYSIAIRRAGRPLWHVILIPLFLFWGTSLLVRIFFGVVQGFLHYGGEFKRTPKFDLYQEESKKSYTRIKMPIDATVFIEFIFLLFIGVAIIKTVELGFQMILGTFFYSYVFLSMSLMFISNISHYFSSTK